MPTFRPDKKPITDSKLLLQDSYSDDVLAEDFTSLESKENLILPEKKIEKVQKIKNQNQPNLQTEKIAQNSYDYNQFYKYESNLSKKLNFIIAAILIIFGFNIFIISRPNQETGRSTLEDESIAGVLSDKSNKNTSTKVQNNVITDNNSIKIIDSFQNNPALVDLGFKVDIGKNYIANYDDSNCQTPIVPPSVNGCGFAVLLSGLGIPNKGVAFKSLNIEANFKGQDNKIQIDQKNYEKGTFTKTLGILSPQSTNNKIILPSSIPDSDTLYFRFWIKSGVVSISKISVDYYLIDDLKKVDLSIDDQQDLNSKTGYIYQDADENSNFDSSVDQKWECQPNFSGVMPVKIDKNTTITLKRDDACYTAVQPDKWQNDDHLAVLPPGKWLLVLDDQSSFAFEVKNDAESFDVKLRN